MNTETVRATPLSDLHRSLGAKMEPFGRFLMPISYDGILREHQAARTGAALFDTCHMGEFRLRGKSALADLERLLSCDIASLERGRCRYGLLCGPEGGVIDDVIVYRLGSEEFMLVVNAGTQESDFAWIEAHLRPETDAENVSPETAKLDVQGPKSPRIVQSLLSESVAELKYYHFMRNRYRGEAVLVSRTGYTGEIGFEVYCRQDPARRFWSESMDLGAVPAGLGARDTLRLEAGLPLYGHELDRNRNAAGCGFKRAISGRKSFIGSDAICSAADAPRLVGLSMEGRRAARRGDEIVDRTGRRIGVVTSGSFAPSLGRAVAMGYVESAHGRAGTTVAVRSARKDLSGVIVRLPFYTKGTARRPIREFLSP